MKRTMLFIPGNNPNMLLNADVLGADGIILDLEDAITPTEKDSARILVKNALKYLNYSNSEIIIRINSIDTEFWKQDLDEIIPMRPNTIIHPKVNNPRDLKTMIDYLETIERKHNIENPTDVIALIETALGVENAFEIASCSSRVKAILLGAEDLAADLGCDRTRKGDEIFYSRGRIVIAARATNICAYDTPFTDIEDEDGLRADAMLARSLGFTGKAAISPRHVMIINEVFSPTVEEIEYAQEVMDIIKLAEKNGKGAISLRGKMIDAPIVDRAKKILDMSKTLGGISK